MENAVHLIDEVVAGVQSIEEGARMNNAIPIQRRRRRFIGLRWVAAVRAAALVLPSGTAVADGHVDTFVEFDPAAGEFPEGIALDKSGNVYVSMPPLGEIRRIDPSGVQSVLAKFDVPGVGPAGLEVNAAGSVQMELDGGIGSATSIRESYAERALC